MTTTIVTRSGKGSPLTNTELDANFTNLKTTADAAISSSGNNTLNGNLIVTGDLEVQGTTTSIDSTTVEITDLNITLAKDATNNTQANGAGITIAGSNAELKYVSTGDNWTINKNLSLGDNVKAQFGASDDLQIYHDGSNSFINDTGTGDLIIKGGNDILFSDAVGNTLANMNQSNSVELYFGGSKKFETTSTGISVTGGVVASAISQFTDVNIPDNNAIRFGNSQDLQIYHDGATSIIADTGTGFLALRGDGNVTLQNAAGTENKLVASSDGAVTIYHDNSAKLATTSTGISITNNANFPDNGKAIFGDSGDFEILSDGTNGVLKNTNGNYILLDSDNVAIRSQSGTNRVIVNSSGIDVTGTVVTDKLTVSSSTADVADLRRANNVGAGQILLGNSDGFVRVSGTNGSFDVFNSNNTVQRFGISNIGNVNIPNGSVGIGFTSVPSANLHVEGSTGLLVEGTGTNANSKIVRGTGATNDSRPVLTLDAHSNGNALDGFGSSLKFSISDSGVNDSELGAVGFVRDGGDGAGKFVVGQNSQALSSSPQFSISASGAATFSGDLSLTSGKILFGSSFNGTIGTASGDLFIGTADANVLFFNSASILPANSVGGTRNDAIDLGSSTAKFKNLHLSRSISSGAITSSGNITLAEYLYHNGDTDTNLRFQTNRATLTSGGGAIVDAHSNGQLYLTGSTVQVYGNYNSSGTISSGAITTSGNLTVNGADVTITANIIHSGDTNTFFGFPTNDQWRFVGNGAEVLRLYQIAGSTGVVQVAGLGSSTYPNFTFNGDTNTGMFSSGADTLQFTTGGTTAFTLNSSQNVNIPNGSLMVGHTVVPDTQISAYHANANITPQIKLWASTSDNTGTQGSSIDFVGSADKTAVGARISATRVAAGAFMDLRFHTGRNTDSNHEKMRITKDGLIGIGTDSPSTAKLVVQGSDAGDLLHLHGVTGTNTRGLKISLSGEGATNQVVNLDSMQDFGILAFKTAGTERGRFNSSGLSVTGSVTSTGLTTSGTFTQFNTHNNSSRLLGINIVTDEGSTSFTHPYLDFRRWTGVNTNHYTASIEVAPTNADANAIVFMSDTKTTNTKATTERLRIDSSGRVGIGSSTGASAFGTKLFVEDSGSGLAIFNRTGSGGLTIAADNDGPILAPLDNADSFRIFTGSAPRLTINSSGNVNIGSSLMVGATTVPRADVHISGNDNKNLLIQNTTYQSSGQNTEVGLRFKATAGSDDERAKAGFILKNDGSAYGRGDLHFVVDSNDDNGNAEVSDSKMVITHEGNCGVGLDSPQTRLHVESSDGSGIRVSRSGATAYMQIFPAYSNVPTIMGLGSGGLHLGYNSDTAGIRIKTNNNVLIGKTADNDTSAGMRFQSNGSGSFVRDNNVALNVNRLTGDGNLIEFRKDSSLVGSIESATNTTNDISIGSGDVRLLFFTNGSSIVPRAASNSSANATIDLGNSGNKFKDAHFSGIVNSVGLVSTGAITSSNGTLGAPAFRPTADINTGMYFPQANVLALVTDGSEALRINQFGTVMVGSSQPFRNFSVSFNSTETNTSSTSSGFANNSNVGVGLMIANINTTNNTYVPLDFKCGTNNVYGRIAYKATDMNDEFGQFEFITMDDGSAVNALTIASNGNGTFAGSCTATSFPTSSDARLKDNIEDADDSGTAIDSLQVRQFDWKSNGKHEDYGMIAQEVIHTCPNAVSVPQEDREMMGIDYSKMVPLLLKEIQELRKRVKKLEE